MSEPERIGLLRMPIGNLQSAWNALYELGFDPEFVDEAADFDNYSHLIVPGVGNFRAVMEHLEARGLVKQIRDFAATGRPTLGICVGMQLLAATGTESGMTAGLGLVDATVERLQGGNRMPLPHVGWSTVDFAKSHPVTDGVKQGRDFYFVHTYAMRCSDQADVLGVTNYGNDFVSVVARDNVVGFQFHPEKSQSNGLKLLENFCHWDGRC